MSDALIVAHGATLAETFENAAAGMYSVMVALETVKEGASRDISVTARDLEGLLVAWLSELLYYTDAEEMVFSRFVVSGIGDRELSATAYGERIDPQRHELRVGVKGVTRHMLEIVRENGGYRARVLVDI